MKKQHPKRFFSNKKLTISLIVVLILGGLAYSLMTGTGPLVSFFGIKPSINETKTLCTRKLDGRKECTTWQVSTSNGVQTTSTNTQLISQSATNPAVEYKFETVKTAPVDKNGNQTGNSTTVEVRKKVKNNDEEVLSTVTTVQKAPVTNAQGKPIEVGEVVKEVRTGDISLGVTSYKSGDKDKYDACIEDGKAWVSDKCVAKDTRSPEQQCLQTATGSSTGNTWANGACEMKIDPYKKPASSLPSATSGVNCDVGMCNTSGSPVCYGTYASTGQYMEGTTEYACRLCGDTGNGSVGFTGLESCKSLLSKGAPVVIGTSANPLGFGLPAGTKTGSCLSKRAAEWVLTGVGQPGEGPNEGMVCSPSGQWVKSLAPVVDETFIPLEGEALCHKQHPGYIYGQDFSGNYVCIPRTNSNLAMLSANTECKPGLSNLGGKEAWIECSTLGAPSYKFCFGGQGKFDENGVCSAEPNSTNLTPPAVNPRTGQPLNPGYKEDGKMCTITSQCGENSYCDRTGYWFWNWKCAPTSTTPTAFEANSLQEAQAKKYDNYNDCARETRGLCKVDPNDPQKYVFISYIEPNIPSTATPQTNDRDKVTNPNGIVGAYANDPGECKYGNAAENDPRLGKYICPTDTLSTPALDTDKKTNNINFEIPPVSTERARNIGLVSAPAGVLAGLACFATGVGIPVVPLCVIGGMVVGGSIGATFPTAN